MYELPGTSVNVSIDICLSFTGLVQRGGGTGSYKDGWGIMSYEGEGCRAFKDPQPSFNPSIAKPVQDYPIKSCSVIAHTRQANRGEVALENTHPFTRELWGCSWTYVHNGQLSGYKSLETGNFRSVGETDSEKAFCWLLHELTERYPRTPGNMTAVFKYIAMLTEEPREEGVFSILLSDGRYVMAFCPTNLLWITRRTSLGVATLPGQDVEINFSSETTPNDAVIVVATQLLTGNETRQKIMSSERALFCLREHVA